MFSLFQSWTFAKAATDFYAISMWNHMSLLRIQANLKSDLCSPKLDSFEGPGQTWFGLWAWHKIWNEEICLCVIVILTLKSEINAVMSGDFLNLNTKPPFFFPFPSKNLKTQLGKACISLSKTVSTILLTCMQLLLKFGNSLERSFWFITVIINGKSKDIFLLLWTGIKKRRKP